MLKDFKPLITEVAVHSYLSWQILNQRTLGPVTFYA